MLLSFSIENYRSIRNKITLNLECEPKKEHPESTTEYRNAKYNRVVSMYGSNASGKSNFIKGMSEMKQMVMNAMTIAPTDNLVFEPFAFDEESKKNPTVFEINFTKSGIEYHYFVSFNQKKIMEEKLEYSPNNRMVLIFQRNQGTYNVGANQKELTPLVNMTAANKLFLCTCVQFNFEKAKPVYDFFVNDLYFIFSNTYFQTTPNASFTSECFENLLKDQEYHDFTVSLLKSADLNIGDIKVKKENRPQIVGGQTSLPQMIMKQAYVTTITHKVKNGEHELPVQYESVGTTNLLALSHLFYEASKNDKVVIADGFDDEIHPTLLSSIVASFPSLTSKTESQLIFVSHNTAIMNKDLLRRDQVVLFDKDNDGVTELFYLSDFAVRKDENYEREYLLGRFGAIPLVRDLLNP